MKKMIVIAAIAVMSANVFAAQASQPVSQASAPVKQLTAQQQKMVDCNKQAKGKTGQDRKQFMSACLKGKSASAAK